MDDIAIIGMACLFPNAPNLSAFWQNIVSKVDTVGDPPQDWEAERYFDISSTANDRLYCKRGGYLGSLARFDPLEFGVMPSFLDGGEPDHYLALKVAKEALIDANYSDKAVNPDRIEVIVGRGTYINRGVTNSFQHTVVVEQTLEILKQLHPEYRDEQLQEIKKSLKKSLPPFTAETIPSIIPNVLTGRIANRLDLMGTNYLVDAACASSLIAVEHGMRDLTVKKCDVALIGGVNASIPPTMLVIFSQINALSRHQQLRPFDAASDGTMLGEGLGFVVLKRKDDAERDGNRIYAILKGVGVASDGRAVGLLSPRLEGEALALKRAYDIAAISPESVGLLEAHGTGTPVGDVTEIQALREVFGQNKSTRPFCALGTVKSMIGHLIPASGMAGLIKTALALYHKILPPTLCDKPNPAMELDKTFFYINTETRPWIHGNRDLPRRAGVSAFGFGGINAHAVLEEYTGKEEGNFENLHSHWETEVFFFSGESRHDLIKEMERISDYIKSHPGIITKDLAYTLNTTMGNFPHRLTIVASSGEELIKKIGHATERLKDTSCMRIRDRSGIYYFDKPLGREGKLAFLFPGEGSQYLNMFSELCIHFPEVRSFFDLMDRAFKNHHRGYLPSFTIFPLPLGQGERFDGSKLWEMDTGAEAVFAANQAMLTLMNCLELKADVLLGHSTGEYSALLASGMLTINREKEFMDFVLGVNKIYVDTLRNGKIFDGVLLSVGAAKKDFIKNLVEKSPERLHIAMDNCPNQVVLCGSERAIAEAEEELRTSGAILERLPFRRAYHTPVFETICDSLLNYFNELEFRPYQIKTYSCASAQAYPHEPDEIRKLATSQWARKVRFKDAVEAIYNEGVRIFIEVGPRGNLTAFVDDILRKRPYLAVPSNLPRCSDITQLNHMVGLLAAHHVRLNPSFLYKYRRPSKISLDHLEGKPIESDARRKPVKIDLTLPRLKLNDFSRTSFDTNTEEKRNTSEPMPPQTVPITPQADNPKSKVVLQHLKNMEQFLNSQEEIFQVYFGSKRDRTFSFQHLETDVANLNLDASNGTRLFMSKPGSPLPFVREVVSLTPGREVVVLCRLTLKEDRFLVDHTLGGAVSELDKEISALPIVPLTFSMEMMAEGAALLMDGKKLVGMKDVRAHRWIALDEGEKRLEVHAKVESTTEGEVKVEIREAEGTKLMGYSPRLPLLEGTMIFAQDYPKAPVLTPFALTDEKTSIWTGTNLYEGFMFHGPSLQGVASIEHIGENGAKATLRAMPEGNLFTSVTRPSFLSDPVILDAAGQVVAYWTSDFLKEAYHIFPFRLEALHLYGPGFSVPEAAKCQARINLVEDIFVRSDIDIIDSDGHLRMHLSGWWDRRFDQPDPFFRLRVSPQRGMLSIPWLKDFERVDGSKRFTCCLCNGLSREFLTAHDKIWMRVLAHLVLSRKERQFWYTLKGSSKRLTEWLLGRIAAKDAVRLFIKKRDGVDICPADIEISTDPFDRPVIEKILGGRLNALPAVSISHSADAAMAVADERREGSGVGVDFELLRGLKKGFDQVAFTEEERALLRPSYGPEYDEWQLRFWCAKEAVSKALGKNLMGKFRDLVVKNMNRITGDVGVEISGKLKVQFPSLGKGTFTVKTLLKNNLVVAISTGPTR